MLRIAKKPVLIIFLRGEHDLFIVAPVIYNVYSCIRVPTPINEKGEGKRKPRSKNLKADSYKIRVMTPVVKAITVSGL